MTGIGFENIAYKWGAYNLTYSSAPRQPEKDLPRQPSTAEHRHSIV